MLLVTHELDEAERLCDRVVAMRAGRVLDSGSPAELVDRHGRSATVAFTLPADRASEILPERFGELPGVGDVLLSNGMVTIRGDRTAIAHVGAALVRAGWIPPDLSVRIPTLEDALVGLLEGRRPDVPNDLANLNPIGALR